MGLLQTTNVTFIDFFTVQLAVFLLFIFTLQVCFSVYIFWLNQAELLLYLHKYNCYYVYRPQDCAISAQFAQLPINPGFSDFVCL